MGQTLEERIAEGERVIELLRLELEASNGMTGHTKADAVWQLAWDYGHAYGRSEIKSYYIDLAELVK